MPLTLTHTLLRLLYAAVKLAMSFALLCLALALLGVASLFQG
jgi:hypothetical protein